jgi:hypothetical protein
MYEPVEIELSRKFLKEILQALEEPIVILGGWAVYYTINERYKETTGREYIGSRDIDFGFEIPKSDLDKTAFAKSYEILTESLGFRPLSFRLFSEFNLETMEKIESEKAKMIPSHQIIQLYIDLVVDRITPNFVGHFNFTPIDEPLLKHVFDSADNRMEINEFGRNIWIPSPDLLLAMKIKSCPDRDKEHKKIKDLCDIAVLLLFSWDEACKGITIFLDSEVLDRFKRSLNKEEIRRAAEIIALDFNTIASVLEKTYGKQF